jgi:hypothetical protein
MDRTKHHQVLAKTIIGLGTLWVGAVIWTSIAGQSQISSAAEQNNVLKTPVVDNASLTEIEFPVVKESTTPKVSLTAPTASPGNPAGSDRNPTVTQTPLAPSATNNQTTTTTPVVTTPPTSSTATPPKLTVTTTTTKKTTTTTKTVPPAPRVTTRGS